MAADAVFHSGGGGSGTVLVVEDDRPTRELLGTILATEGIEFQLTSNGHEAMRRVHEQPPAMVILDLHLPSVQGEAIGTALRIELGPKLPIMAMSASFEEAAAERIGAYAFLGKPFDIEDFVGLVRTGLRLAAKPEALARRSDSARERLAGAMERQRVSFELARTRLHADQPDRTAASK